MVRKCNCPEHFPDWDNTDVDLTGHCILKLNIPMFMNMPLAFEAYLQRQQREVENLELQERWPRFILTRSGVLRGQIIRLLEHTQSPSRHLGYMPTPFNAKAMLHNGDIGTIKQNVRALQHSIFDEGKIPGELYLSYLTCPKCTRHEDMKILLLRRWVQSARLTKKINKRKIT
ncbi:MAG: hypothetical protein GXP19_07580 [Gammaproteobacteria bacterium]|nr:hypothetical protein [Gammaproteobacteria bacterium]